MTVRRAMALAELLCVLAAGGLLLGLLAPAVQRVREAAARTDDADKLRLIGLAFHGHAEAHKGKFPVGGRAFYDVLPWLEHGTYLDDIKAGRRNNSSDYVMVPYLSASDPTVADPNHRGGIASFAYNARLFIDWEVRRDLQTTTAQLQPSVKGEFFADGLAHTILVAGHYGFGCDDNQFSWFMIGPSVTHITVQGFRSIGRRSSFADVHDFGRSPFETPTVTFQVRPAILDCDPRVPQTPFAAGLLVGLADGSVRTVAPGVSPGTFWAAVTPAGGEVLGPDW